MSYKVDFHLHSVFSPDGRSTPEADAEAAVKAGLNHIIFTDHCECNNNAALPPTEKKWPELQIKEYTERIVSLQNKYPLKIGIGVEIGQPVQGLAYAEEKINAFDWDIILGSNHNIRDTYDFCFLNYRDFDINDLCHRYFAELYEVVKWNKFDVLAHLYYFIKYIERQELSLDLEPFDGEIYDLLKLLAANGKGLEVNTSCLFEKNKRTVPGYRYLRMFKELGGEAVTVGSDSHFAERIGSGIEVAYDILRGAGFKYITSYEKRKPTYHLL